MALETVRDTYLVNGVDLRSFTTRIETAEGLQDTPEPVGEMVELPGLDGAYDPFGGPGQPRPPDGVGRITFNMSLVGVNPDNGNPVTTWESSLNEYFRAWDKLVRLFHARRLTIDHPALGGTRRAVGRLAARMEPSRERSSPWFGRFKVVITIPGAYWSDLNTVTTGTQSVANNGTLDLSVFASATAPCTDLLVRFGPGNNPRLSTTYNHLGWNGVIAAGRQVEYNTATGQITSGLGATWTPPYAGLDYSPGPRLFEVDPSEPLLARLTHTGSGSIPVEVVGRRRYRTSGGAGVLATTGYGVGGYGVQGYGT